MQSLNAAMVIVSKAPYSVMAGMTVEMEVMSMDVVSMPCMHAVFVTITMLKHLPVLITSETHKSMIFTGICSSDIFRCQNGNCVKSIDVCNYGNDCGDNSDEFGCGKLYYELVRCTCTCIIN